MAQLTRYSIMPLSTGEEPRCIEEWGLEAHLNRACRRSPQISETWLNEPCSGDECLRNALIRIANMLPVQLTLNLWVRPGVGSPRQMSFTFLTLIELHTSLTRYSGSLVPESIPLTISHLEELVIDEINGVLANNLPAANHSGLDISLTPSSGISAFNEVRDRAELEMARAAAIPPDVLGQFNAQRAQQEIEAICESQSNFLNSNGMAPEINEMSKKKFLSATFEVVDVQLVPFQTYEEPLDHVIARQLAMIHSIRESQPRNRAMTITAQLTDHEASITISPDAARSGSRARTWCSLQMML